MHEKKVSKFITDYCEKLEHLTEFVKYYIKIPCVIFIIKGTRACLIFA